MAYTQDVLDILEIGLPIEIEIPTENTRFADVYFSQVMDIGADYLTVSLPQRQGEVAGGMGLGSEINLRVALEDDATYLCICRVRNWSRTPPALVLTFPHLVHRIQRRNFVRVDAAVPLKMTFYDHADKSASPFVQGTMTTDLSGGGMLVTSPYPLPIYQDVEIEISLPNILKPEEPLEIVTCKGQICRSKELGPNKFQIGISVTEIEENERDKIVRYIFKYQRESLKSKPHLSV